ncbi:tRNA (cmo5U34)-methyltransferase [hydrothermal vent metagenome]|uniref:tRNA (Cmo5U34)-methyltransferase n=1 Tax=hydrothermal vent metagenome TaxID=652676 RepID=A0A3B0ZYR2_9ZZZZ
MTKPPDHHDNLYAEALSKIPGFEFDAEVAQVFEDMINRSVPGYREIISIIGILSQRYAQANSICYDLGCSLGAAILAMRANIPYKNCKIVGVDSSLPMLTRCKNLLAQQDSTIDYMLACADIQKIRFDHASMVILNFTLQFIPPAGRINLLQSIYNDLKPGGVLILSEKIAFETEPQNDLINFIHYEFKKTNGYSALEISQKRSALDNVLVPDTLAEHQARLGKAGFKQIYIYYQNLNFMSLIAIK